MFNFTAIPAIPAGNAKDARTGERINGRESVRVYLSKSGDKARYFLAETWAERVSPEQAARVVVGATNRTACRYQAVITCPECDALHAAYIGRNGSQPVWYATPTGYCSPTFRNAKWHDRLDILEEMAPQGKLRITITAEDTGEEVATIRLRWDGRDELGRFLRKEDKGDGKPAKSTLLRLIDRATMERKGYSNY